MLFTRIVVAVGQGRHIGLGNSIGRLALLLTLIVAGCTSVDHKMLNVASEIPATTTGTEVHELRFDAGRCSSQSSSWALGKDYELDNEVPFDDGGMVERYKNDRWNGLRVTFWNTNAGAYGPDNSFINVTVQRGLPGMFGTTVTVDAHADCDFWGPGNWMYGTLNIYYKHR